MLFPWIWSSFSSWCRERCPLQMEISFRNVNVSYRRIASTWFSELFLYLWFLKNNQLKIILMQDRHILGWYILSSFNSRKSPRFIFLAISSLIFCHKWGKWGNVCYYKHSHSMGKCTKASTKFTFQSQSTNLWDLTENRDLLEPTRKLKTLFLKTFCIV